MMTGNNLVDTFPLNRIVINPSGGDDDAAINAAITSLAGLGGGKVELGSGLFNIASAILMASNIVLQGQGRNLTVLRLKDNTPYSDNANVIFAKAGSSDMSGWAISDLSIDANRAGQQRIQNALTITALSRSGTVATATVASTATLVSGEFVFIKGAANGAYNGGFAITVLSATQFRYTVASGTDSTSGTMLCTTQDNAYNGISVRGSSTGGFSVKDWTIQNFETKNAGYHGIAVYGGCSNFGMSTIHSHHNGFRSIHVHASRTVTTQD